MNPKAGPLNRMIKKEAISQTKKNEERGMLSVSIKLG